MSFQEQCVLALHCRALHGADPVALSGWRATVCSVVSPLPTPVGKLPPVWGSSQSFTMFNY